MLIELLAKYFPTTYEKIFNIGMYHGIDKERRRDFEERAKIRRFEKEQLLNKKVIIISNEWEDPIVGEVVRLEDFDHGEGFPVVRNAITNQQLICFGKVVPFSVEGLKALVQMSPWTRWEILTGQKIIRNPPDDPILKTFDQFMEELDANGFFGVEVADMLDEFIDANN
jgi:hypothetical protein